MARIRCRYDGCAYLDDDFCTASLVEFDPDQGCLTYKPFTASSFDDDWELDDEEEEDDFSDWEEEDLDDDWFDEDEF